MSNQQNQDPEIKNFEWYHKNAFKNWESIAANLNEERFTYRGTDDEDNPHYYTIMKLITIKENANYKNLLKEEFNLSFLKKNRYFVEIIDVFLSKNNKKLYNILRKEGKSLYD